MDYFVCTTCQPHTTLDHEMYAPRACLICECKQMVNGEVFVKRKYVITPEDSRKTVFKKLKDKREASNEPTTDH